MDANQGSDREPEEIVIAIAKDDTGEWEYISFETKEEARKAINEARSQGKAAVFYSGGNDDIPPETWLFAHFSFSRSWCKRKNTRLGYQNLGYH